MLVNISPIFKSNLKNFPKPDQLKIKAFVDHVKLHGLLNLEGRNKYSDNVPTDDPNWLIKVKQAQKYNLWHYHIGIAYYIGTYGDKTSEYVLHYTLDVINDQITLVHMSPHPPFELPDEKYLNWKV